MGKKLLIGIIGFFIVLIIFFALGWIFNRSAFNSIPGIGISNSFRTSVSQITTVSGNFQTSITQTTISVNSSKIAGISPTQNTILLSPDWANNDIMKGTGFEIEYDANPHTFIYPLDNEMDRSLKIKNTGTTGIELQFNSTVYNPYGNVTYLGVAAFPQTGHLIHLNPGENQTIYTVVGWTELFPNLLFKASDSYAYNTVVTVFPVETPAVTQTIILKNRIKILTTSDPRSLSTLPSNASIFGYVTAYGKPVQNAKVQIFVQNGQLPYNVNTDANGFYNVNVTAYKSFELGSYLNYDAFISVLGYKDFNKVVTPKKGDSIRLDVNLTKKTESASYNVTAKYDITLNIHRGAASKDGKYIAIVPFHTINLPANFSKADNAYLWVFDNNGNLLWKYKLNGQTPTVDVSDDGKYIATIVQSPLNTTPDWGNVYVFDNKSNVIWNISNNVLRNTSVWVSAPGPFGFGPGPANPKSDRASGGELKFSHNGRYLAIGDASGNFWLFDMYTRQKIWNASIGEGQIRNIKFEANDSVIYISGANGYLYAYTNNGQFIWRTYVGSWLFSMTISKNYIMTGPKVGYYTSLLAKNGTVLWRAPIPHVGFHLEISPDESYMVYFSEAASADVNVFNKNGQDKFFIPPGANGGTLSGDGNYIILAGIDHTLLGDKTYVKLITKDGDTLWSNNFDSPTQHPEGGYSWISPDKTRIIATTGEYIYFLKGAITQNAP